MHCLEWPLRCCAIVHFFNTPTTPSSMSQIEVPQGDAARLQRMKARLWARYPIDAFNLVRCVFFCLRVGARGMFLFCFGGIF